MTDYQALAADNLLLHFSKPQVADLLVLERAEGPYVFDSHGRRYIDALSSLFCAQIGYSYGAEMAEVATRQLTTLPFNTNWATAHPAALELAEKVSSLAPADDYRVYFTSGGSEAVESAWKLVREHYVALGQPQRRKAIARQVGLPRRHPRRPVLHRHPQVQGRLRSVADRGQPRQQHQPVPGARR